MKKTTWISIDPVDTLFFRGAESMVAGENHEVDTMFPPMPTTIVGAIRTAILCQNKIDPGFMKNEEAVIEGYPILGSKKEPGFDLIGPLLAIGDAVLLPAPAHWFAEKKPEESHEWQQEYLVQAANPLPSDLPLAMAGSTARPFWISKPVAPDMEPLSGWWVTASCFETVRKEQKVYFTDKASDVKSDKPCVLPPTAFFAREERLGIALTSERAAKEGHLYTTVHVRLTEGVRVVVGVNTEHKLQLAATGILQLGGEQRICQYQVADAMEMPAMASDILMSLSPVAINDLPEKIRLCPRASGKIFRVGGWDMAKEFHKPMTAWLPAGTAFHCPKDIQDHQYLRV